MFTSSIIYRIKRMLFTNGNGIVSAITVSVLCFAALSRSTLTNEVLLNSHDVTLKSQKQANQLAYDLNNRNVEHYYNYKEVVYAKLYKDHMFTEGIASFIAVTSDKYIPNVNIDRDKLTLLFLEGLLKTL